MEDNNLELKKCAVQTIERVWLSGRDRQIFKMLKHAVCAAENSVTSIFLQTITPREAELLQDPSMSACVRLRFGGSNFPPMIYFKIYYHHSGPVIKYFSGKTMIHPAALEANEDCLRIKGPRLFYEQLLHDNLQNKFKRATDSVDVVTLKDYMQYLSYLDETPAKYGGKSNYWRLLSLNDVRRHTIFYSIVEYLHGGRISKNVRQYMSHLLMKPVSSKIQLLQLNILSSLQTSSSTSSFQRPTKYSSTAKKTKRRSERARRKVSKMKELYEQEKNKHIFNHSLQNPNPSLASLLTVENPSLSKTQIDEMPSLKDENNVLYNCSSDERPNSDCSYVTDDKSNNEDFEDLSDLDNEAAQLYEWTKHLSIDNVVYTPQF